MTEVTVDCIKNLLEAANSAQSAELKQYIEDNIRDVSEELRETRERLGDLEKRHVLLERKLRKNNVVLFGMETTDQDLKNLVLSSLNEKLQTTLHSSDLSNVYKIGRGTYNNCGIHLFL